MSTITLRGRSYEVDELGFLSDFDAWDRDFAEALAPELGIEGGLTESHWGVLRFIREFYDRAFRVPVVYQVCRANGLRLRQLGELFPRGYLRGACRLAGVSCQAGYLPHSAMARRRAKPEEEPRVPVEGRTYTIDGLGFLVDPGDWDRDFARLKAHELKMEGELGDGHWRVIDHLRGRFETTGAVPTVAGTCGALGLELEDLERLFPDGYNRGAVKIAGLRPGRR